MKLSAALATLLFAAPAALAQSTASGSSTAAAPSSSADSTAAYLQQVLGALTAANLTSLVSVAQGIANTTAGAALLGSLAGSNKTVFAPSNAAFANVSSAVSSNTTLLTQILSYHILNGSYTPNATAVSSNHTIARSFLQGGLPGNRTAPLVLTKLNSSASSIQINQATTNISAQGPVAAANLQVYIIPQIISLPGSIADVATSLFPSLAGVITQSGLLTPLASAPAITVFAPNDAAVAAIQSALGTLNATQIQTVLANHIINGTSVYSTGLGSANYTSAAGSPFTFTSNSSGTFVTSANSTARIIQSDIIINNGVVHLIDGVLVNTASNAGAAASAYSSATAGATGVDPVVAATSSAAASGASSSAAASSSRAAAGQVAGLGMGNVLIAGAVGVVGAALGGGYILA